jgi:hypothetical protein
LEIGFLQVLPSSGLEDVRDILKARSFRKKFEISPFDDHFNFLFGGSIAVAKNSNYTKHLKYKKEESISVIWALFGLIFLTGIISLPHRLVRRVFEEI